MAGYKKQPSKEQVQKWQAQAREQKKAAFEQIRQVAENYQSDPVQMVEYLQFATQFYQYSEKNISLIYGQNPYATFVQSFQGWKDMGESVVRGAKGLKVFVPSTTTYIKIESGEEAKWLKLSEATAEQKKLYKEGKLESRSNMTFKLGNVFDISQTTFPKERYPEIFSMGEGSDRHKEITEGLIRFSENVLNCPVTTEAIDSIALFGYYVPSQHRIALNERMEDTMRLSTMSHELGHAMIHHDPLRSSTAQKEFEGDAISIMLQKKYGIELTEERKSHLAKHYEVFRQECEEKVRRTTEGISKEELEKKVSGLIEGSFQNVFRIYKEHIPEIERCVEEQLQEEKTITQTEAEEAEEEVVPNFGTTEEKEKTSWEHGHLVEERRCDLQITETELAYLSMISVEELKKIEAGEKKPDDVTLLLIANTLGVRTAALEEGRLVEQKRKDITEVIGEIKSELEEIAKDNDYVKNFLQSYGIEAERYHAYPKENVPNFGTNEREEVRYVVFDTLEETYVADADGTAKEWESLEEARAYAEKLNAEPLEEEVVPNLGIEEEKEEDVPNFGTDQDKENFVPNFGTEQEKEKGRVR